MEIKINYPPKFESRYGYGRPPAKFIDRILMGKLNEQRVFLKQAQGFRDYLSAIPVDAEENDPEPRWNQPWFPPLDGISLYTLLAGSRPGCLVEIGSGNSTKFARRAIRDHGLDTKIVSIDPEPRAEIDALSDTIHRSPLEEVDQAIFAGLVPGDIVFFDGSHRCFQNSDVTVFFIDVLPALRPGVIVGIHDIFWPNDYPAAWIERYFNEQYMLGAYMLALGSSFPLILSCAHSAAKLETEARACLHPEVLERLKAAGRERVGGGCVWFQKPAVVFD